MRSSSLDRRSAPETPVMSRFEQVRLASGGQRIELAENAVFTALVSTDTGFALAKGQTTSLITGDKVDSRYANAQFASTDAATSVQPVIR